MRAIIMLLAAFVLVGGCAKAPTASPDPPQTRPNLVLLTEDSVMIRQSDGRTVVCPAALPNPATVKAGDSLQFHNDTGRDQSLHQSDGTFMTAQLADAQDQLPTDTTANYVTFHTPGTVGYYSLSCRVNGIPFSSTGLYSGVAAPYSITVTP